MSAVRSAVGAAATSRPRHRRAADFAPWLVVACYLLAAVALTGRLWVDPASRAQIGDPEDVDQFAWFLRYAATAVAHGHLPALFTAAMNAPRGINLMSNTSVLLPGVVLTPLTLTAGPQVSLTLILTLGFAGSAAALFWVLRRWGASISAAALGGAVYGFSPAMVNSAVGHYNLQFAVLPPLIVDALLRIASGRGSVIGNGVRLGLLAAAQLFIGEELLAMTAVAGAVLLLVLAIGRPGAVPGRLKGTAASLALGAGLALVICGRALWVQFHGPLPMHGSPWPVADFTSNRGAFVTPAGSLLFHTRATAAAAAGSAHGLGEYLAYLGWPLLVVLIAAAIAFWRDARVRAAGATFAVLEIFSLGGNSLSAGIRYPAALMPWHWLQDLPVLSAILPDRFALVADGAAAALLAFSLDRSRAAIAPAAGLLRRSWPLAIAVLAAVPVIPLPLQVAPITPVPAGWEATLAGLALPSDARILVVPVPDSHHPQVLRWQAETGQPGSFSGGWFIGPNIQSGQSEPEQFGPVGAVVAIHELNGLWAGSAPQPGAQALVRGGLRYLRPAAIVAVTRSGSPLERFLAGLFGQPASHIGRVFAWRVTS